MNLSEVATARKDIGIGSIEVHTMATPSGYRVSGEYHTADRRGRLVDGLVGGRIVQAEDLDAEIDRVSSLAESAAIRVVLAD